MADNFLDKEMRENIELIGMLPAGRTDCEVPGDFEENKFSFYRDELSMQCLEPYGERK